MKNFLGIATMLVVLGLTGCQYTEDAQPSFDSLLWEEELGLTDDVDVEVEIDEMDAELFVSEIELRSRCIELVFPVVIEFPDGSMVEADDGMAIKAELKAYYEANGKGERPKIQLPFEVETRDGEVITIEERGEVRDLLKECLRKARYARLRDCFDIVYPVGVILPNGEVIKIENESEMKAFLKRWRMNNRGATMRPRIEAPFNIETKNGETITVGSREDMKVVIEDCKG